MPVEPQFLTLQQLGTFTGTVLAVVFIIQFIKTDLDRLTKFPTRYAVLVLSWILLFATSLVTGTPLTAQVIYLNLLNGFPVALAAMGSHAVAQRNLKWR